MSLIPFDDRDGHIWLDGKLVPWRDAKLHALNHGLHYASCVFEGERVYDGTVFKLTEHSQRLIDSAALLDFTIPFSLEEIDAATRGHQVIERAITRALIVDYEAIVRGRYVQPALAAEQRLPLADP